MLEQYTSLTFTGHTRGNAMEPFLWSGGPIGAPKGPQMTKNDNFGAIRGCCGSALAEQCGIKVEQVRAHPGRFNGTVSRVMGCLWGAIISAYGPKMLFLAVLDPFWGPLAHPDGPH